MALKKKSSYRLLMLSSNIEPNPVSKIIESIFDYNEEDKEKLAEDPKYKPEPINIIINSGGGIVHEGFALIDVMENSTTPIYTTGYGSVMSIALPILLAGHKRFCGKFTTFMYHEVSHAIDHAAIQYHKQELQEAERLQKVYNSFILSKCKLTSELLNDIVLKRAEYYFDANKAKEYGVVHKIL